MSATPCCHKVFKQGVSHSWFHIYRCLDCGRLWCHHCGKYGDRCPNPKCGSKRREIHSKYHEEA